MNAFHRLLAAVFCALLLAALPASGATVVLVNLDPPGVGLNDPTPATPVGGNPGVTIGEQRVNVYLQAAEIWGDTLDSAVPIVVGATFQPLPCEPTGGVLGSAGPTFVFADFANAPIAGTWYVGAQADALVGADLEPGELDIISFFNSSIDDDVNCLTGSTWYYGLDNNQEASQIDFLTVVVHEINHGLGHLELVDEDTGELFLGLPDIYSRFMLDLDLGTTWENLTDAERLASQVNSGRLVWNGPNVTNDASDFLGPRPSLGIFFPRSLRGRYEAQPASFGPPLTTGFGTIGKVVLADDGVGVGSDACEPIQNTLFGKLALIDRGGCAFTTKVANAEAAGARGAIVANNVAGGPAPMGGADPTIGIPSVGITLDLGDAIKASLDPLVLSRLFLDRRTLAGTEEGFVRLHAPDPVTPGSSKSHWSTSAEPSLLMEPSITPDLESAISLDLSPSLLLDIGWPLQ
ncbi:MAG: PA domain-containing protein [Acidobacteriota bacterium]